MSNSLRHRSRNTTAPKIVVKKEPSSPVSQPMRHRPRKLDLSSNTAGTTKPTTAGPLTARESSGLGIQDVGLACLSPGFITQDPTMREQLQRSISVREQQRQLIEQRLQQSARPADAPMESARERDVTGLGGTKTPSTSKRKAPPGLSIVAPSHEQFANERVIQSAPLNQTFTGRQQTHPLTRHVTNQPSNLSSTSHIHHVPANQTNNRLPPISDVFAHENLGHSREPPRSAYPQFNTTSTSAQSASRHPLPSPNFQHTQTQQSFSTRPREYKSAEDAQAELSGGRSALLPKLVHYGGHQPPTPPSPLTANAGLPSIYASQNQSHSSRRRQRAEYEDGSPPLGNHPGERRRTGAFGEGRDSPDTQQKKKEEFLRLCDRAWDLFHS